MLDLTTISQMSAGALVVVSLYIIFNFVLKITGKGEKVSLSQQIEKMNNNHLTHIEQAIREQTALFQKDHEKNMTKLDQHAVILSEIKGGIDVLAKKP